MADFLCKEYYIIYLYIIYFLKGFLRGKSPTRLRYGGGERKKLSGISNQPILADTKREMPNEGDCSGRQPRKVDRCGRGRWGEKTGITCRMIYGQMPIIEDGYLREKGTYNGLYSIK
jgi:hypothetical protein